ncbi:MAG: hypothetical protein DLM59_12905 [Pseudonocardiales bacterium]|nr:MAG: hypothetical protein DLM59_12905 [Pseudonocardiales bacterium]
MNSTFEGYVAGRGQALLRFGYVLTGDPHLTLRVALPDPGLLSRPGSAGASRCGDNGYEMR